MKLFNKKLVKLTKSLNWFWYIFYFLTKKFVANKKQNLTRNYEILIFDFHLIGDIVLLTPVLKALKDGDDGYRITLVCGPWAKEVLLEEGLVDDFIFFTAPWVKNGGFLQSARSLIGLIKRLRCTKWDIGVDIRGDIRQILLLYFSGAERRISFDFMGGDALLTDVIRDDGVYRHLLNHHQLILNKLNIKIAPQSFIPKILLTEAEQISSAAIQSYVGVHFGASLPLRRLPLTERIKLLEKLAFLKKQIVIFVPPDEAESIDLLLNSIPSESRNCISLWRGSIREMIVMISAAEKIYAMDSGAAHIAAALGIPTVVLFGPNLPALVAPIGCRVEIREKVGLGCRPCNQINCTNSINQACLIGIV